MSNILKIVLICFMGLSTFPWELGLFADKSTIITPKAAINYMHYLSQMQKPLSLCTSFNIEYLQNIVHKDVYQFWKVLLSWSILE